MAGIYIHIPFCKKRCVYCDFFSTTLLGKKPELLRAIGEELAARKDYLQGEPVETVYIGGGTPSLLTPGEAGALLDRIAAHYDTGALKEVTLEANPDDLTPEYLRELRRTGVNRLSIGIQSFIDRDLRWMNRRHDAETARRAVRMAREAGFDNLSLDLIYGLPAMSPPEWECNIREMLALAPEHISAYHLTFEEGTLLGRRKRDGKVGEIGEEESRRQFLQLHEMLSEAGYAHYEVSNFARPGYRAVHNSNYWNGHKYLGVGPSAHSYDGKGRRWNVSDVARYVDGVVSGICFEGEILSVADRFNEYVMTSLRCDRGVDPAEITREFGAGQAAEFVRRAGPFLTAGTLEYSGGRYRIPPVHYLVSDDVISSFFLSE